MLIDTHCHIDLPAFDADREPAWQRARAIGVRAAVIPAVEPATWDRTRAAARPGERFVAIGIHPRALPDLSDDAVNRALTDLARVARDARAVAIGECGLDGAIDLARAPMDRQLRVLAAQIEIARALDLPLILHVVRAHEQALALLSDVALPARAAGVVHSYSGGPDRVRAYVARGFHLAFGGALTRPNARRPVDAARAVPRERLLLETDAPDQAPTGASESRCEPAHIALTAARLATVRSEDRDELVAATARNACALFAIEPTAD